MPTYSSNSKEIINLVSKAILNATQKQDVVKVASEQLQGDIETRIWTDHKATDGNEIGTYSTDPMYASLEWNSKFVRSIGNGRGKNSSSSTFKNGKKRKSKYYAGGYKEYKQDVKGVSEVNLELTGQLRQDFGWTLHKGYAVIGFGKYGAKLWSYLEEKYSKPIFTASDEEIKDAVMAAEQHVKTKLSKL